MLDQIARVLRPGGVFFACEWGCSVATWDEQPAAAYAPQTYAYFELVKAAFATRGVIPIAERLEQLVRESGRFDDITARRYSLPVGPWDSSNVQLGRDMRSSLVTYVESLKPLLVLSGRHPTEVDDHIRAVRQELEGSFGLVVYYYTVRGRPTMSAK